MLIPSGHSRVCHLNVQICKGNLNPHAGTPLFSIVCFAEHWNRWFGEAVTAQLSSKHHWILMWGSIFNGARSDLCKCECVILLIKSSGNVEMWTEHHPILWLLRESSFISFHSLCNSHRMLLEAITPPLRALSQAYFVSLHVSFCLGYLTCCYWLSHTKSGLCEGCI